MDLIWDLITLPFELVTGGVECIFGCLGIVALMGCCIMGLLILNVF